MSKRLVWLAITIGSTVGSWLGSLLSKGNWFGWQGILGGALGAFLGIYAVYKLSTDGYI